jgi:hypothetical protein
LDEKGEEKKRSKEKKRKMERSRRGRRRSLRCRRAKGGAQEEESTLRMPLLDFFTPAPVRPR